MGNNPLHGIGYVLRGLGLIARPGLRRFVIIPLFINTTLFAAVIYYGARRFDELLGSLLPQWLDWLSWLLWPIFAVAVLMVVFYTFTIIANLIAAPFNGLLAERVEQYLRGTGVAESQSSWSKVLKEALPAILSELKKLAYFLVRAIPLLLLFLIPGLNVLAPFLWIAFNAWFLTLEYGDYPMGNHGMLFPQQRQLHLRWRWTALGFGTTLLLITTIPILNFLAMPVGVAGATAMWVKQSSGGAAGY